MDVDGQAELWTTGSDSFGFTVSAHCVPSSALRAGGEGGELNQQQLMV